MLESLKSERGHADFGCKVPLSSASNRQTTQVGTHFARLAPALNDKKESLVLVRHLTHITQYASHGPPCSRLNPPERLIIITVLRMGFSVLRKLLDWDHTASKQKSQNWTPHSMTCP